MAARSKNTAPAPVAVEGFNNDYVSVEAFNGAVAETPVGKATTLRGGRRNTTFSANASLDIDFDAPAELDDLQSERSAQRSMWVRKLDALRDGIEAGKGTYDKFYRIGAWPSAAGATNVIRTLGKKALPGIFQLEARVFNQDGQRVSELWASMPADQTGTDEEWIESDTDTGFED